MQRQVFNYAQGRLPGLTTLLLAAALLLCAGVLLAAYRQLTVGNAALQQQLIARQSLRTPIANQRTRQPTAMDQALATEMAEAQWHIHTPWLPLLQALEQAHQPSLYWMQLAPDAKRKHLHMVVLAHQRQQGWALVDRLKKQSGLSDVKLNASESTEVSGLTMTTFHLEAGWTF